MSTLSVIGSCYHQIVAPLASVSEKKLVRREQNVLSPLKASAVHYNLHMDVPGTQRASTHPLNWVRYSPDPL